MRKASAGGKEGGDGSTLLPKSADTLDSGKLWLVHFVVVVHRFSLICKISVMN